MKKLVEEKSLNFAWFFPFYPLHVSRSPSIALSKKSHTLETIPSYETFVWC